jgi:hypothetical protein
MKRSLVLLVAALAVLSGCKENMEEGGAGAGDDPNTTYTLKVQEGQQGDKRSVVRDEKSTFSLGKDAFTTESRVEYTEELIDFPVGAAAPTRATRTYTAAKITDLQTQKLKPMSLEGKTLAIEKKGTEYRFTVEGKELGMAEKPQLQMEFEGGKTQFNKLMPTQPVKVGETWTVPAEALRTLNGGAGAGGIDENKSKLTCKLARAYKQDGKQRGVIEFEFDIVTAAAGDSGAMKLAGSIDSVIDGSVEDYSLKGTAKGSNPTGSLDASFEKTVKPAS